jgi:hypothetical protein
MVLLGFRKLGSLSPRLTLDGGHIHEFVPSRVKHQCIMNSIHRKESIAILTDASAARVEFSALGKVWVCARLFS